MRHGLHFITRVNPGQNPAFDDGYVRESSTIQLNRATRGGSLLRSPAEQDNLLLRGKSGESGFQVLE